MVYFQVFLVGLVSDVKYSHFKPVLDVYIEETFSATLAYKYVVSVVTDVINTELSKLPITSSVSSIEAVCPVWAPGL